MSPRTGTKQEPSRRSAGAWLRFSREARIGTAALLSFLILVTALVVQKWKNPTPSGKQPPVAKIASPEVASAAPTAQAPTALSASRNIPTRRRVRTRISSGSHPGPRRLHCRPRLRSPPTFPPRGAGAALKVPDPATEPAQYTTASNPEPALPPSTSSAPESGPAEAPSRSRCCRRTCPRRPVRLTAEMSPGPARHRHRPLRSRCRRARPARRRSGRFPRRGGTPTGLRCPPRDPRPWPRPCPRLALGTVAGRDRGGYRGRRGRVGRACAVQPAPLEPGWEARF